MTTSQNSSALNSPAADSSARWYRATASALIAAFAVLGAIIHGSITGWAPEQFQVFVSTADFTSRLAVAADSLRVSLAIDALFMGAYLVLFLTLCSLLRRRQPVVAVAAIGAILATLFLDIIENQLLLAALGDAESGGVISTVQLYIHVLVSQAKFHLGYFGLLLFGLLLPSKTFVERQMRIVLIYVQLPVGTLVFLLPGAGLALVRSLFFAGGLVAFAWIAWNRAKSDEVPRATQRTQPRDSALS